MGATADVIRKLPTPEEMYRERLKIGPLSKGKTRAEKNTAAAKDDERQLADWRNAVGTRDKWIDRFTGKKTERTLAHVLNRAEAHHLSPRANKDTRFDRRNGVHLSLHSHEQVTHGEIRIKGTSFYRLNSKRYIDADFPLIFEVLGPEGHVLKRVTR